MHRSLLGLVGYRWVGSLASARRQGREDCFTGTSSMSVPVTSAPGPAGGPRRRTPPRSWWGRRRVTQVDGGGRAGDDGHVGGDTGQAQGRHGPVALCGGGGEAGTGTGPEAGPAHIYGVLAYGSEFEENFTYERIARYIRE